MNGEKTSNLTILGQQNGQVYESVLKNGEKRLKRNKKIKRIIKLLILIIIVVLYMRINVMDRIYSMGLYKLDKVPEAEGLHLPRDLTPEFIMETFAPTIWINYMEEYLKDNIEIALLFTYNSPDIVISETVELSDTAKIVLRSNYNHSNKKLIYNQIVISIWSDEIGKFETYKDEENINKYLEDYNVTRQDVEAYQNYAVYDTVVKTWIKANGGIYPLEWLKLKACTIDNTFLFKE